MMDFKIVKMTDRKLIESYDTFLSLKNYNSSLHFKNKNYEDYNKEKTKELLDYLREGKAIVLGAYYKKELIGFIWGYPRVFFYERRLFINSLVVDIRFERRGIGSMLMKKILIIAKEEFKCDAVDLTVMPQNIKAVKFYKSLGFIDERIQMRLGVEKID